MNLLTILIDQPIINALVVIYNGLQLLHVPFALGFSIIVLTIFIRILIYPLISSQLKHSIKMQKLAPLQTKIKEKHKGDMKAQQVATMELYKEHGFNPLAGCLPALMQFPLLIGLYGAVQKAVQAKSVNDINKFLYSDEMNLSKVWDTSFFGLPLGKNPGELLATMGPVILLVIVFSVALQLIQSKMMAQPASETKKDLPATKDAAPDMGAMMQKQMLFVVPFFIGYISYVFPLGLSLYWNTFTLFGIIQQYRFTGLGGLSDWLKRK